MPGWRVHAGVGAVIGAAGVAILANHLEPNYFRAEILGGMMAGGLGGRLPDWLEPATSPRHRGPAHSWVALLGLGRIPIDEVHKNCRAKAEGYKLEANAAGDDVARRTEAERNAWWCHLLAGACLGGALGYGSHLFLDAGTPIGLPVVGINFNREERRPDH